MGNCSPTKLNTPQGPFARDVTCICMEGRNKFKSQSLNSLFRSTASSDGSTTNANGQLGSGGPNSGQSSNAASPSPRLGVAQLVKSPKPVNAHATSSTASGSQKPITTLETASGSYKLAALVQDPSHRSATASESKSTTSTPEPRFFDTYTTKMGKSLSEHNSEGFRKEALVTEGSGVVNSAVHGFESQHNRREQNVETGTNSGQDRASEGKTEHVIEGAHAQQHDEHNQPHPDHHKTQFSWDDDEDDDNEWKKELEALASDTLKTKSQQLQKQKEQRAEAASANPRNLAPWAAATKTTAVSIDQQLKELTDQKAVSHNYLGHGHGHGGGNHGGPMSRRGPLPSRSHDHYNDYHSRGAFGGRGRIGGGDMYEPSDRYRYSDYEKRYRPGHAPSQELYNARSNQVEPAPGLGDRQLPERISTTYVFKRRSSTVDDGEAPINNLMRHRSPATASGRTRRDSDTALVPGDNVVPSESRAKPREEQPPAPIKEEPAEPSPTELLEMQKKLMAEARERAKKRKEEELQKEQERIEAAHKRAQEIAQQMEEKERKEKEQKRKEREECEKHKKTILKKERSASTISIEQRAIDSVKALVDEDTPSPKQPKSKGLALTPTTATATAAATMIPTPTASSPKKSDNTAASSSGPSPAAPSSPLWNAWKPKPSPKGGFLDDSNLLQDKTRLPRQYLDSTTNSVDGKQKFTEHTARRSPSSSVSRFFPKEQKEQTLKTGLRSEDFSSPTTSESTINNKTDKLGCTNIKLPTGANTTSAGSGEKLDRRDSLPLPIPLPPVISTKQPEENIVVPPLKRDAAKAPLGSPEISASGFDYEVDIHKTRAPASLESKSLMVKLAPQSTHDTKTELYRPLKRLAPYIPPARTFSSTLYKLDKRDNFWHEREFRQRVPFAPQIQLPGGKRYLTRPAMNSDWRTSPQNYNHGHTRGHLPGRGQQLQRKPFNSPAIHAPPPPAKQS